MFFVQTFKRSTSFPEPSLFMKSFRPARNNIHKAVNADTMFTWDSQKAILNLVKHSVSFEEAATVFGDPGALDWEDPEHSETEVRFKRLGMSRDQRILIVIYTIRRTANGDKAIRLISARRASRKERKAYSEQLH